MAADFATLLRTLARRRVALAVFAVAVVVAALSRHVLHIPFARFTEPPMIVAGFVLGLWALLTMRARSAKIAALEAQAVRLADAVQGFGGRIEAWLVATLQTDELEAEALRRALVDRHTALVAAIRAHLSGRDPHDDTVVHAMTREKERKGRHGAALLLHLGTLQREAIAEAQRRGFLGEVRLLALDDALCTLSTVTPIASSPASQAPSAAGHGQPFGPSAGGHGQPFGPSAGGLALCVLTAAWASLQVLGSSQRLMVVAAGALAGITLIAFEAFASAPITADDDPRIKTLASVIEG